MSAAPLIFQRGLIAVVGLLAFLGTAFIGFMPELLTPKLGLISLLAVVGMIVASIPIAWSITVLFLYIGIEGYAKIMTGYNPVVHVGADILVLILVVRVLLKKVIMREGLPRSYPPVTPLLLLHFGWFVLTFANPYALGLLPSLAGAKLYLTMPCLFFFGYTLANSPAQVRRYMAPWVVIALVQASFAVYQGAIGSSSVTGWNPAYAKLLEGFASFRPFGLTSQPGMPANYVFAALPFKAYFLITAGSGTIKACAVALLPLGVVTLFVCQIRSALLKGIVGSALFLALAVKYTRYGNPKLRRNLLLAVGAIGVTAILVTPYFLKAMVESSKENESAIERTLTLFDFDKASKARGGAIKRIMAYASISPLGSGLSRAGAGARLFPTDRNQDPLGKVTFFTDNLWVALVIDLGIPGVIIVTLIMLVIIIRGARTLNAYHNANLQLLHASLLAMIIMIAIGSFAAEPILYNPEAAMFWFFSGAMMRLPQLDNAPRLAAGSAI